MKKLMIAASIAASLAFTNNVMADEGDWEWSPVGIGIAAPIQLPWTTTDVCGFRFGGLFGHNRDVAGIDVGLVELTSANFAGIQWSGFSWTSSDVAGLQLGMAGNVIGGNSKALQTGLFNVSWGDAYGAQIGGLNYGTSFYGLQCAVANWSTAMTTGARVGGVNVAIDDLKGVDFGFIDIAQDVVGGQIGVVNCADTVKGFQIGFVNACDKMTGVQIGFVNLITTSKLPVMVVLNTMF